jgi:hypothetical protein
VRLFERGVSYRALWGAIRLSLAFKFANLLARFFMGECKRPKTWPKAYQLKAIPPRVDSFVDKGTFSSFDPVAWNSTIGAIKQLSAVPAHLSTLAVQQKASPS